MARGDFVPKVKVISDEDPEIARERRLVDANEVPALPGSWKQTAPLADRHQANRIDAVREERDEQFVKRQDLTKIAVERLERALGVEDHPEGDGSGTGRPVGLHQDEGVDDQAIFRHAEPLIPPTIKIRHHRTHVFRLLEHNALDTVAVAPSECLYVFAQGGCKSPLGLWTRPVGGRGLPSPFVGSVASQVGLDAVSTVHHLVDGRAATRTELEDMPVATACRGPPEPALHDDDRSTRRQTLSKEALVGRAKGAPLEPEVAHALDHQPVLHRVLHVVKLELWVPLQNEFGMGFRPAHLLIWLVRRNPRARHGYQKRLGQPRDAESCPQM